MALAYLVGVMTMTRVTATFFGRYRRRSRMGSMKAAVFPLPVVALAQISLICVNIQVEKRNRVSSANQSIACMVAVFELPVVDAFHDPNRKAYIRAISKSKNNMSYVMYTRRLWGTLST